MAALVHYAEPTFDSARWERFEHRSGDVVISTPPKCGTTWTQMLCALLIFDDTEFPAPLALISPWLDMLTRTEEDVFASLDAQTHRRFIKTHTPLDGIPMRDDVTYVVVGRDPRDAMVSQAHHRANLDMVRLAEFFGERDAQNAENGASLPPPPDPANPFRAFVEGGDLERILHHLDTGWQRRTQDNVGLFHFADYQTDLVGEMGRLADLLEIEMNPTRLAELASAATLDEMRGRADELAPSGKGSFVRDKAAFFRTGGSGEWRELGTDADFARYDERVSELVEPALARWVHLGRIAGGIEP